MCDSQYTCDISVDVCDDAVYYDITVRVWHHNMCVSYHSTAPSHVFVFKVNQPIGKLRAFAHAHPCPLFSHGRSLTWPPGRSPPLSTKLTHQLL